MELGSLPGYAHTGFEVEEFDGYPTAVNTLDGTLGSFIVNGKMTPPQSLKD